MCAACVHVAVPVWGSYALVDLSGIDVASLHV